MNIVRLIFQEFVGLFVGLFVDDEMLAVSILAVVGGCWLIAHYMHDTSPVIGALLVAGCVSALLSSVVQGAKK